MWTRGRLWLVLVVGLVGAVPAPADGPTDVAVPYRAGNRVRGWNGGQAVRDRFLDEVQPILTSRCIACHGCHEAPCQLNLQSFEAVRRGFHATPLYSARRAAYVPPTRMSDATTVRGWRAAGFLPVASSDAEPARDDQADRYRESLLFRFLTQASTHNAPGFPAADLAALQRSFDEGSRHECVGTVAQVREHFTRSNPWRVATFEEFVGRNRFAGMPFGLPRLTEREHGVLVAWLRDGSPGPSAAAQRLLEAPARPQPVTDWEAFLNTDSAQGRQTARYIYEHVFSALLYLEESSGDYFELVRSRTAEGPIDEIVTEVPYEAPGARVHYRLRKVTRALVQKTQNVWRLSAGKLRHLRELFLDADWGGPRVPEPEYGDTNPFRYFSSIPARIRSQFLMENSRLIVGAMVQGTVCIGTSATYAIADHFWVWFLRPEADPSVSDPSLGLGSLGPLGTAPQPWVPTTVAGRAFLRVAEGADLANRRVAADIVAGFRRAAELTHFAPHGATEDSLVADLVVQLRGYGLQVNEILGAVHHFFRSAEANQQYQAAFERSLRLSLRARGRAGLTFDDLWTGGGDPQFPRSDNPNAWISVTRHERSATVQVGPEGGFPQSVWVLSYSNFERLYYNLVAHFKVWGNATHKLATWRHMSYVRLEGEDLAISLLPVAQRGEVRGWFSRGLGGVANRVLFPLHSTEAMYSTPPRIPNPFHRHDLPARPPGHPELGGRTAQQTVSNLWAEANRRFRAVATASYVHPELASREQFAWEETLRALQGRSQANGNDRFAQFLPNLAYVRVQGPDEQQWIYSLVANRGYQSHTLVFLESPSRDPGHDTLSVFRGFTGAYPEVFLDVRAADRGRFVGDLAAIRGETDWAAFRRRYAVARNDEAVWRTFDALHRWKSEPHPGVDPVEQGVVDLSRYLFF